MSFGNYENISMSADVEDGETVGEALEKLEAVINSELKRKLTDSNGEILSFALSVLIRRNKKTQQLPFGKKLRR